ncbi:histidinol dehydrogenase [Anaerobacterium chartisolvens]|uniref:Histidinol dehydrogenase n=1 Tax=Anaerobacterium chartisolvens TaxID=1297424 RepID=A0A369AKR1_9FIRM|nr:histidinol dehydrogenase [Anaerobacterium chartisolvens]RCX08918.1 histidinol dehydrogenase [Anaerobacterium chartisolvens]
MIDIIDLRGKGEQELINRIEGRNSTASGDIMKTAEKIISDVRSYGDRAVFEYSLKLDGVELSPESIRIPSSEIESAYERVNPSLIEVIRKAKKSIEDFHYEQKEKSWFSTGQDGVILGQMYRPLEIVGLYVPGGTAAYPSSVLMNAVPAKVAGVEKIVMITPPKVEGINPAVLVAANEAGVDEIYRVGGAQGVAALAFGTSSVPKVDKIVGPGNAYVAAAKKLVYGVCDIDAIAGPSEIAVVADNTANAAFVAADLLSQAEHDILASSIAITDCEELAEEIKKQVEIQAASLPRREIISQSLHSYGAVVVVESIKRAIELVNIIAPEHLELCVKEPFNLLGSVKNAGAIFLGHYASEPLGDYFAGPNHVLPTNGTARFFSPLNVADFIKKSSVISYTREALEKAAEDVILFAEAEGLKAHANAIRARLADGERK